MKSHPERLRMRSCPGSVRHRRPRAREKCGVSFVSVSSPADWSCCPRPRRPPRRQTSRPAQAGRLRCPDGNRSAGRLSGKAGPRVPAVPDSWCLQPAAGVRSDQRGPGDRAVAAVQCHGRIRRRSPADRAAHESRGIAQQRDARGFERAAKHRSRRRRPHGAGRRDTQAGRVIVRARRSSFSCPPAAP